MKATMSRNELLTLHHGLETNLKKFTGVKLAYAVAKNTRTLSVEVEDYKKAGKPTDEFKEYRKTVYDLNIEHCLMNASGTPDPGPKGEFQFSDAETREMVASKVEVLQDENKEMIKAEEEKEKEFAMFLQEKVDIDLHAVTLDELNDTLDGSLVSLLVPFLEE